jgi:hypothetical protein
VIDMWRLGRESFNKDICGAGKLCPSTGIKFVLFCLQNNLFIILQGKVWMWILFLDVLASFALLGPQQSRVFGLLF